MLIDTVTTTQDKTGRTGCPKDEGGYPTEGRHDRITPK